MQHETIAQRCGQLGSAALRRDSGQRTDDLSFGEPLQTQTMQDREAVGSGVGHRANPTNGSKAPRGALSRRSRRTRAGLAVDLTGRQREGFVLLAGVGPVLELDHAELPEPLPQPAVAGVEQAELLAVRHDLREQHLLEELALRRHA